MSPEEIAIPGTDEIRVENTNRVFHRSNLGIRADFRYGV